MLFSKEDFKVDDPVELLMYMPIFIFFALVAPFLAVAYTVGFVMDVTGRLND